mgnify:CR=1 FL=1
MAELKYIPFYPGYMEDTSDLSDSEFRRLMYALAAFCNGEEPPEPLTGKEVIAYRFVTRNIRAAQDQYNAKCKANSENAKKRTQATANERKRTLAKPAKTKNKEQRTKTNIIPPTPLAGGEGVSSRFVPPTPQEVDVYCQKQGKRRCVDKIIHRVVCLMCDVGVWIYGKSEILWQCRYAGTKGMGS